MQLLEEQTGPVFQLVTASQQQPTLFSFEVEGFVARTGSDFRKLTAFAGTAIAIGHVLTQVVQHSAKPQRRMPDWLIPGFRPSIYHEIAIGNLVRCLQWLDWLKPGHG